ncbi:Sir2 silent information regulator family NAD-dependent deacetylase [uncultured Treponema sp.]|uniref:SIR2 family NAD-dependent protein deacylase n=1 Tax=uncultured Treponema sp. TaxID=162155 RepID=UPI0025F79A82|nr:Sir2 silent information regulator family NAD-dependent deacetylase [uncultured Treponema sp.]MEE0352764.1 Sir2 silent information regulator family NAD-dependent deacetylase [Treponema sp.]
MSGFENISNEEITKFHEILDSAECVVVGAGAGLSASAGFSYSGGRFRKYFSDFEAKYHFHDMYSGGFADFCSLEENWAYWSRFIYINRYMHAPLPVYEKLLELVRAKDYFVITTNVDHCFQKAGFDKKRLFYTQGDYGLFQCCVPCHKKTYDNEEIVKKMLVSQGFEFKDSENKKDGGLIFPENPLKMEIPSELVPHCPVCGKPMSMNLRCDETFVEDDGWHEAARRYQDFLEKHKNAKTLFLELGVGGNTPGIIKYPFWNLTYKNKNAFYVSLNMEKEEIPIEIKARSVLIKGDIFRTIGNLDGMIEF